MNVNIVTKSYCPYCHSALQLLDSLWVEYNNIDITSDEQKFDEIKGITGSNTVPQIFAGDIKKENFLWGYSDISALNEQGKLKNML